MSANNVIIFPDGSAIAEPPSDFRRTVVIGLAVVALAFGGVGGWAATAPLSSAVVAHGQLVIEGNRKTVQHFEGGIVRELLVRDGDQVAAGDLLIRLDGTRDEATVGALRLQLAEARALEARLMAERDGDDAIAFPRDLMVSSDARIATILDTQRREFAERDRSGAGQEAIMGQRVEQLRAEIEGRELQLDTKQRQLSMLDQELSGLRELVGKGFYPRNRLLAQERDRARIEGEIAGDRAAIARSREAITEAELETGQLDQTFREKVVADLRDAQNRAAELSERLIAAQDVAQRLEIRAPVSGIVQDLQIFTVGGVLASGAKVMDIVPEDGKLIAEARLAPNDIEVAFAGKSAEVRLPALNSRTTPSLQGQVLTVSPDRLSDPRVPDRSFYLARIEIPPEEVARLEGHRIQAGMPVDVMISAGQQTLLGYLLKPVLDSFSLSFRER